MRRIVILLFIILSVMIGFGQVSDTVTLEYCYKLAQKNYPMARQVELLGKSNELRIRNLNKSYLPQLNLNGNVSLQSEVTDVKISLPANFQAIGMPPLSKDWYKLTLDVNQSIYDGNLTNYQKKIENSYLQTDEKNIQIELYKIKDRINQVYFSIFLTQESESLLNSTKTQLEEKKKEIQSAVKNGTQLASNEDAIQVELLKIDQQLTELRIDRTSAFQILSELTSTTIPEASHLMLPKVQLTNMTFENSRLEYQLFDLQQNRLGLLKNMVTTKWNPRIFAYGQVGYGRPGFNMLSNDFTPWWIFGAKLNWNIWNWNQNKNEKKIYDIQHDILNSQKETFDKNTRIEADRGLSEIMKLTEMLKHDEEIILLREKITHTASSQMENGIITSSEYISRLNEETQARLSLDLHRIQLVKAKLYYLYIIGKL
jgi:outer membrane protein TolC